MNLKKLLLALVVLAGASEAFARGGFHGGHGGFHGGGHGWHGHGRGWGGGWGWGLGGAGLGLATGYALGTANDRVVYTEPSTTYVIDRSAGVNQSELAALRADNAKLREELRAAGVQNVHPVVHELRKQNELLRQQLEAVQAAQPTQAAVN